MFVGEDDDNEMVFGLYINLLQLGVKGFLMFPGGIDHFSKINYV